MQWKSTATKQSLNHQCTSYTDVSRQLRYKIGAKGNKKNSVNCRPIKLLKEMKSYSIHCGHIISIIIKKKRNQQLAFCNCYYRQCPCNYRGEKQLNYKAKSWSLCLGKISTEVFLSNDSKLFFRTSKHFIFSGK